MTSRNQFIIAATTAVGLLLVAAIYLEKEELPTWQGRLAWPTFEIEENRHTPRFTEGTYLPPTLLTSRTFTAEDSPIIVAGTVTIPAGITMTLAAGTTLYVHEYGSLTVQGTLESQGEANNPVRFSTNELHVANRHWSGIVFAPGSRGQVRYTTIRHASPGITCETDSTVAITGSTIELGSVGVFSSSPTCTFMNSTIRHVIDGLIAIGHRPVMTNTQITAQDEELRLY